MMQRAENICANVFYIYVNSGGLISSATSQKVYNKGIGIIYNKIYQNTSGARNMYYQQKYFLASPHIFELYDDYSLSFKEMKPVKLIVINPPNIAVPRYKYGVLWTLFDIDNVQYRAIDEEFRK